MSATTTAPLGVIHQVQPVNLIFSDNKRGEGIMAVHPSDGKAIFPHHGWEGVKVAKHYKVLLYPNPRGNVYIAIPDPAYYSRELFLGLDTDNPEEADQT